MKYLFEHGDDLMIALIFVTALAFLIIPISWLYLLPTHSWLDLLSLFSGSIIISSLIGIALMIGMESKARDPRPRSQRKSSSHHS